MMSSLSKGSADLAQRHLDRTSFSERHWCEISRLSDCSCGRLCRETLLSAEKRARTEALRKRFLSEQRPLRVQSSPAYLKASIPLAQARVSKVHETTQMKPDRPKRSSSATPAFANCSPRIKRRYQDFTKRSESKLEARPSYVINTELKPVAAKPTYTAPDYRKTFFANYRKGVPKFHFIDPDWFSERDTFKQLVEQKRDRFIKYHWI